MTSRFPIARTALLAACILAVAAALPSCAPLPPPTVSLRLNGNVRDATVTINDRYVGKLFFVTARGVALPPGRHRISVEKAGFFPWDSVVEVHEGDPPVQLDVALTPIPD